MAHRPHHHGRSRWLFGVVVRGLLVWVLLALGTTEADAQRRRRKRSRPKPRPVPAAPAPRPEPQRDTPAPAPTAGDAAPAGDGRSGEPRGDGKSGKAKVFDFTGLDISGRLRAPQLLYFLERANEELERASLERRSFIPEMMRTLDEEQL